jgi:hypothetical protein
MDVFRRKTGFRLVARCAFILFKWYVDDSLRGWIIMTTLSGAVRCDGPAGEGRE